MIPPFNDDGLLPPGVHPATLEEFESRFVVFDRSDRRLRLYSGLESVIDAAKRSSIVKRILVVGSYITATAQPNDFDCLLILDQACWEQKLCPFEYNLVSRSMARRLFRGDVFAESESSPEAERSLSFFQRTRQDKPKGIVEILLWTIISSESV